MIVTIEQIQRGICTFIENEVGRRATGLMKFTVYFMLPALPAIIKDKVQTLLDTPGFTDMFDTVGNIQLDTAYSRAKEAMLKIGKLELPQYHMTLEPADIDTLYSYIQKA